MSRGFARPVVKGDGAHTRSQLVESGTGTLIALRLHQPGGGPQRAVSIGYEVVRVLLVQVAA